MLPSARSLPDLAFGGDYNPEQWPLHTQLEDMPLMAEAGVNLVTVGVFSWALIEPREGEFEFDWLDDVLDRLHAAGVRVDLATATASPPAWLSLKHPEMLPVDRHGTTLWHGARQAFCPSSPVYRAHALRLCRAMAQRYAEHPAVCLWHVSNELGCHVAQCYCDVSALAFREWLRARYGDVASLNDAWGTAFWSQRYDDFDEVLPPRSAPASANPTQQLDFRRFSSDELLANFVAERDVLREASPDVPITTNFMVMQGFRDADYWAWAQEIDVISNDHYPWAADPDSRRELSFSADLTRGLAGGRPWLLMEQAPSAVNWQPRNIAKRPGELLRNSLQHVARGADAVLFFQWRASRAGAEKFHSALVPHAGTDTRLWREVVDLGGVLERLREVAGSVVVGHRVAMLFDWQAWWATELDSHPSVDVTYLDRAHDLHRSLTAQGVGVDFVAPGADLSGYDLVVVPTLYSVTDGAAATVTAAAERGATILVTYFSGIVDQHDHIRLGGYPGAFRDLLGIRVEEFTPLREGARVLLSDESSCDIWTEHVHLTGAEAVATYVDGPVPGGPAVTRHRIGSGEAWYVSCRLDEAATDRIVSQVVAAAGIAVPEGAGPDVEIVRRGDADGRTWMFAFNHGETPVRIPLRGYDLVSETLRSGETELPGGSVAVVRED